MARFCIGRKYVTNCSTLIILEKSEMKVEVPTIYTVSYICSHGHILSC